MKKKNHVARRLGTLALLGVTLLSVLAFAATRTLLDEFDEALAKAAMPSRFENAVAELKQIMPPALRKQIDPVSTELPQEEDQHVIRRLVETWRLDDWNSPLTHDSVQLLGLTKPEDIAGTLIASTLETSIDRDRLARSFALARFDGKVIDAIPTSCTTDPHRRIGIVRVKLAGYSRDLHWVTCDDKTTRYYLWERAWFDADTFIVGLSCNGMGDHPHNCPAKD